MQQRKATNQRSLEVPGPAGRLDKYLAKSYPEFTRTYIQKLIESGNVTINGRAARVALQLKLGDHIEITIPPPEPAVVLPEDIPFGLVYEDGDVIVINKPAGLTVHPAPGHSRHTLVNALIKRFPDLEGFGGSMRPGIVHRLDKDTSGLMVIARSEVARQSLINQFKSRSVKKCYLVLIKGKLEPSKGAIDAPIGRDPSDRKRMAVVSKGRNARTDYRVLKYLDGYTLVEANIRTGRTHQIRVHFKAIGYPVVGDAVYGVKSNLVKRQFLHAYYLQFKLPSSNLRRAFTCELPDDLKQALITLGGK
ncbi:MAG: RluA family pseudouridine synthase [Dehalococcoidia bacterium]|jgi:23S rRNA pseudouridine1911/1915/1917 synthase